MTAIGSYVVVFLDAKSTGFGPKSLQCRVLTLFPIENGWVSSYVLVRTPVYWSPCLQATTFTAFLSLRVEALNLWLEPSSESCSLQARWPGNWCTQQHITAYSTMFDWERGQNAAPQTFRNKGGRERLSFLGPIPFDSAPRRLQLVKFDF